MGPLGRITPGKTPSTVDRSNFDGPSPFIPILDLDGRVLIGRTQRTLSEKSAKIFHNCLLPLGSIMMSFIATSLSFRWGEDEGEGEIIPEQSYMKDTSPTNHEK